MKKKIILSLIILFLLGINLLAQENPVLKARKITNSILSETNYIPPSISKVVTETFSVVLPSESEKSGNICADLVRAGGMLLTGEDSRELANLWLKSFNTLNENEKTRMVTIKNKIDTEGSITEGERKELIDLTNSSLRKLSAKDLERLQELNIKSLNAAIFSKWYDIFKN